MRATALEDRSGSQRWFLAVALLVSAMLHVGVSAGVSRLPPPSDDAPVWVEIAVATVEPVPEPEPDPEVEPEPEPEPEPEVVEYEPETELPEPVVDPKPVPRVVQGLNANSFAEGSGSGLNVRAGTTTSAKATDETMDLDDATESAIVPFASVTKPPKVRYKPPLEAPQSVIDAKIEGRVELLLTVGADGKVQDIQVVERLTPDADATCVSTMRRSRWKPGTRGDTPVTVKNVPYSCRYEMSLD